MSSDESSALVTRVDVGAAAATLQKVAQFQRVCHSQLKQGHDYGVIPHTSNKPVLLKPGAEKILMLLGLRSEFDIVDCTRDWENGFFQYLVKCRLFHQDIVVTEGMGSANTRERKYTNQNPYDPYTLDNTVLKMAKKRALVDAALLVGALSDVFTQDIEDMELESDHRGQESVEPATEPQRKKIYALVKELGWSKEHITRVMVGRYNKGNSTQLTKHEASDLIEFLSKQFPQAEDTEEFRAAQLGIEEE